MRTAVSGSGLTLDALLPTSGGLKRVGDVGSRVSAFTSDGRAVQVAVSSPGDPVECFRLTFRDGTSIVAAGLQKWQTRVVSSAAKPRVRQSVEMFNDPRLFMVPGPAPRQTGHTTLSVDPYLLGVWLGDGSTGQPNITSGDDDVDELRAALLLRGIETHELKRDAKKARRIGFSNRRGFGSAMGTDVAKALRSLPCYRDKHIPPIYLASGTEQRLELLRGLMDTDGHVTPTGMCIFVGRKRLTEDTLELLRTLGQDARLTFAPDLRSREGGTHRITFTPQMITPFAFRRKAERVVPRPIRWRTVASISYAGPHITRSIISTQPAEIQVGCLWRSDARRIHVKPRFDLSRQGLRIILRHPRRSAAD